MAADANNWSVEVKIFDQAYSLYGSDSDCIRNLAAYVDSVMRIIAEETHMADSAQLAVLTAVRIANELLLLKAKVEGEEKESGEEVRLMTEEGRQRNRERRQRHFTRRSYVKQLLAIVNDDSVPAKERHEALFILGRVKGYHRRPTGKS